MFLRLSLFLAALALITASAAPSNPSAPRALTLDEAIHHAWARDPQVAALALAPQLAQARELQAGLRPLPRFEANTSLGLDDKSEWTLGLGLSQSLPRRERVALARAYARLGGEAAPITLALRRAQLANEVRRLWYAIAVQEARAALAERMLSTALALVDGLVERHAVGEIAESDWLFLQLELGRSAQTQALAQAELEAAHAQLRARLRWPETEPLPALQSTLDPLIEAAIPKVLLGIAALPSLRIAEHEIARAQAALDLARSESREDWTVGAGVEVERRTNDASGRLSSEPRLTLSTSAPWPVRSGRAPNRGVIAEREAALRIAQAELDALRDEVTAEVIVALSTAHRLQPEVLRYRDFAKVAATAQQRLKPLLERGEISPRELGQAQQQHTAIEAEFLDAAARYLEARASLEAVISTVPAQDASNAQDEAIRYSAVPPRKTGSTH